MFSYILLICGVFSLAVYSVSLKPGSDRCTDFFRSQIFNLFFFASAFVGSFCFVISQGRFDIPAGGILSSFIYAAILTVCLLMHSLALQNGPVSLTTLFINFSLLAPVGYSFIFFNEKITPVRIAGIALMLVCLFLFTNPKLSGEKLTGKWWLYTILCFATNGALLTLAKSYAVKSGNLYASQYVCTYYLFAAIITAVILLVAKFGLKKGGKESLSGFFSPKYCALMIFIGLCNYATNFILTLLATRLDSAIVYPVIQGGGPLLSSILSAILFKEKIPPKKAVSILVGVAAIVLLNL